LWGRPEAKRPLGRRRSRWEFNIKVDLKEIVWEHVDLMTLAQDTDTWRIFVNTVMSLRVLRKVGNFLNSLRSNSFSKIVSSMDLINFYMYVVTRT
jgi:hypothetical protein